MRPGEVKPVRNRCLVSLSKLRCLHLDPKYVTAAYNQLKANCIGELI